MSEELNSNEERVLEVLLSEIHGANDPPDLSAQIMKHLDRVSSQPSFASQQSAEGSDARNGDDASTQEPAFVVPVVDAPDKRRAGKKTSVWLLVPIAIATAASIVLAVWMGQSGGVSVDLSPRLAGKAVADDRSKPAGNPKSKPSGTNESNLKKVEGTLGSNAADPALAKSQDSLSAPAAVVPAAVVPAAVVPAAVVVDHDFHPGRTLRQTTGEPYGDALPTNQFSDDVKFVRRPAQLVIDRRPGRLVAKQLDDGLRQYWKNLGVTPTDDAISSETIRRVEAKIGVAVSKESLSDVDRLRALLVRRKSAESITRAWLDRVTDNGFRRLDKADRDRLADLISNPIAQGKGFDRTLRDLISGDSTASVPFYQALGSNGEYSLRHRIASLSMNVDLRCTRCHESSGMETSSQTVGRPTGTQKDYWSFTALLRSRFRIGNDGRWTKQAIRSPSTDDGANRVYYDLPDGRRQLAAAAVPANWMRSDVSRSNTVDGLWTNDVEVWADDLVGSRPLARGIVNSLWQLLMGRPLVGSGVDAGFVHDPALLALESELSDDLIASDFDLARTLALMIRSVAFRRSVPEVLTPHKAILARREQLQQADRRVASFAGSSPMVPTVGLQQRAMFVLRASGSSIDLALDDSKILLSQAEDAKTPQRPKTPRGTRSRPSGAPADFPSEGDEVSVKWLDSIVDFDAKVAHLSYLSGRSRSPVPVTTAVAAMQNNGSDDSLILKRVWWMLSK